MVIHVLVKEGPCSTSVYHYPENIWTPYWNAVNSPWIGSPAKDYPFIYKEWVVLGEVPGLVTLLRVTKRDLAPFGGQTVVSHEGRCFFLDSSTGQRPTCRTLMVGHKDTLPGHPQQGSQLPPGFPSYPSLYQLHEPWVCHV